MGTSSQADSLRRYASVAGHHNFLEIVIELSLRLRKYCPPVNPKLDTMGYANEEYFPRDCTMQIAFCKGIFVSKSCFHRRSNSLRPRAMRMTSDPVKGISDIVRRGRYRGVLLDQFGVLHDGVAPYRHTFEALEGLRKENVHIVVLSNSSRRADYAAAKLRSMGLGDLDVVTSGELAREILRSNESPIKHCSRLVHTNWTGRGSIDAADVGVDVNWESMVPEDEIREVDGVVLHGTEGVTVADNSVKPVSYDALLRFASELGRLRPNIPFVCVNPDIVTVDGGVLRNMPGALAATFERAGGTDVVRIGKPGRPAYDAALRILARQGILPEEIICVGDSVAHDILGATESTLDSIYIAGGIDSAKFGLDPGGDQHVDELWSFNWNVWDELVSEVASGCGRPTYVLPYFRW